MHSLGARSPACKSQQALRSLEQAVQYPCLQAAKNAPFYESLTRGGMSLLSARICVGQHRHTCPLLDILRAGSETFFSFFFCVKRGGREKRGGLRPKGRSSTCSAGVPLVLR